VRGIVGCIADYGRFCSQAFDHLTPGGWVEVQEYEALVRSNEPCDESKMKHTNEWARLIHQATASIDKPILVDAGFEGVTEMVYRLPFSTWPKGPKLKEIGRYQLAQMLQAVDAASPAVLRASCTGIPLALSA